MTENQNTTAKNWYEECPDEEFKIVKKGYILVRVLGVGFDSTRDIDKISKDIDFKNIGTNWLYFWSNLDPFNKLKLIGILEGVKELDGLDSAPADWIKRYAIEEAEFFNDTFNN